MKTTGYTVITAKNHDGEKITKTYKGLLSHRQVVRICERLDFLFEIFVTKVTSTGKVKHLNIGY